jgi:hypothetical protein
LANSIFFCAKSETIAATERDRRQSGTRCLPALRLSASLVFSVGLMAGAGLFVVAPQIAQAQSETWLLGPNSRSGQGSTVVPTDCVTGDDGSITCNTKIENPAGTTPAKPYYNPFTN